jgi:hypothetical protein
MKASKKPWAIALRIAPYPGPFVGNDLSTLTIVKEASRLIQEAKNHEVNLDEFQLDFDCAKKKLNGYHLGTSCTSGRSTAQIRDYDASILAG